MRRAISLGHKTLACALTISTLLFLVSSCAHGFPEGDTPTVPNRHVNDVFDIANEEYKAGDYEDAVRLYEGLLSGTELKTADIYYNLGNAYFKLQKHGKAIASYRRASQIAPREQDILANLSYVRSKTKDKIDRPNSTEILHEVFFFHYGFNRAESEALFLCSYFAAIFLSTIYLFRKSRVLRWLAVATLVPALAFGASALVHARRTANPNKAVVVVNEADIHTGPGQNYMLSFSLHDGAELEIRRQGDGWYQIELPDERRGWIRDTQVEIIS